MKFLGALMGLLSLPLVGAMLVCFVGQINITEFSWDYHQATTAFAYGFVVYIVVHFFIHKPILTYVFGHELTHAIAGKLFGAKISQFKVSKSGGSVNVSKSNFVITLAPYFFPIYSLFSLLAWWVASLFWQPLHEYVWVLYALTGVTWAFHICMTVESIFEGQPDITSVGAFFALPLLIIINVEIFAGALHFLDVGFDFVEFNKLSYQKALVYYLSIYNLIFSSASTKQ